MRCKSTVSEMYKKYFPSTTPEIVLERHSGTQKQKDFVDTDFIAFCRNQHTVEVSEELWRVPKLDLDNSYRETAKFFTPRPAMRLNEEVVREVIGMMVRHLRPVLMHARKFSFEEVVRNTDLKRSAGFPWNNEGKSDKEYWLKGPGRSAFDRVFREFRKKLQNGDPTKHMPAVFMNCPKHEIRKRKLVKTVDIHGNEVEEQMRTVRTFMAGSLELHMLKMMYFMSQNQHMTDKYEQTWLGAGVSYFHGGWHRMVEKMKSVGDTFFETDVSGWDRSLNYRLIMIAKEVRVLCMTEMLTPEEKHIS